MREKTGASRGMGRRSSSFSSKARHCPNRFTRSSTRRNARQKPLSSNCRPQRPTCHSCEIFPCGRSSHFWQLSCVTVCGRAPEIPQAANFLLMRYLGAAPCGRSARPTGNSEYGVPGSRQVESEKAENNPQRVRQENRRKNPTKASAIDLSDKDVDITKWRRAGVMLNRFLLGLLFIRRQACFQRLSWELEGVRPSTERLSSWWYAQRCVQLADAKTWSPELKGAFELSN